jgi:hypothetical protein
MSAEWAAHPSHPPIRRHSSLMPFNKNIQIPMNPFCAKNLKTNYNVMRYGDHGTERVKIGVVFHSATVMQNYCG